MKETNWEWVDINLLKIDGVNPNFMSKSERESLKNNLTKFGWNMPIITDLDYLIADGEQKWEVAKEMEYKRVPVLRKKLTDTERRLIRQSMNKLRGTHNPELDAEEFKKILTKTDMEEITTLIGVNEQEILNTINYAEKNNEAKETAEKVEKLGSLRVKCPKCGTEFEKTDSA